MPAALATRPRLHLTAQGWVNDPLGLSWHDGAYHVFFQYLPGQSDWSADCHWGHAISRDLLAWTEQPVALRPGEGDGGCWSGSLVIAPGDSARMFYTSVQLPESAVGQVRIARPADPAWQEWRKGGVVAELPDGLEATAFRDPQAVRADDAWLMVLGVGYRGGTAAALAWESTDLETWTYRGELARRHTSETEGAWTGGMWECPQLLEVGGQWFLVVSVWEDEVLHYVAYAAGSLERGRFTPSSWRRLTYGRSHYAASAFRDSDGGPGLVHWLRGVADVEDGWAGALSLPHRVRREGERLVASPPAALESRRGGAVELKAGEGATLPATADVVWRPAQGARLVVTGEQVLLDLRCEEGVLRVEEAQVPLDLAGDPEVRLVLDVGVVEVFAPEGVLALPLAPGDGPLELRLGGGGEATAYPLQA